MHEISKVKRIIFAALDEYNSQQPKERRLKKALDTALLGNSTIDSLRLVSLIMTAERRINEEMNASISLADENAMSQKHSPFKTVSTLIDHATVLLKEENNG